PAAGSHRLAAHGPELEPVPEQPDIGRQPRPLAAAGSAPHLHDEALAFRQAARALAQRQQAGPLAADLDEGRAQLAVDGGEPAEVEASDRAAMPGIVAMDLGQPLAAPGDDQAGVRAPRDEQ